MSKALIIATNDGVETDEILRSISGLREGGVDVTVAAVEQSTIHTVVLDAEPGTDVQPDTTLDKVAAADFDALIIPGGTVNADVLRVNEHAQALAKDFAAAGKLIGAVCHGPWLLVNTGLVKGKTLTSAGTITVDLQNAGGTWVDEAAVLDENEGYALVTSRNPKDMDEFTKRIVNKLS